MDRATADRLFNMSMTEERVVAGAWGNTIIDIDSDGSGANANPGGSQDDVYSDEVLDSATYDESSSDDDRPPPSTQKPKKKTGGKKVCYLPLCCISRVG